MGLMAGIDYPIYRFQIPCYDDLELVNTADGHL